MAPPTFGPMRRTLPAMMAMGPLGRIVTQTVVAGIAIIARTLPAAYAAALDNARKSGIANEQASSSSDPANKKGGGGGASFLGRARMSKDEALMVLNLTEEELARDVASVQRQYDRYFAVNAIKNGGSFSVQSKIYRAKELLDEYANERKMEEEEEEMRKEMRKKEKDEDKKE
jgi:import inner membrane translocase subunit TIM16